MKWTDYGIVVSAKAHGETSCIVHILTEQHGLHAGYFKGGQGKTRRPLIEPGNHVVVEWQGRLSEQLGYYNIEPVKSYPAQFMHSPGHLLAIQSACDIVRRSLPERQSYINIYNGLLALFDNLDKDIWAQAYIIWEVQLLRALGFGLQLDRCASTGIEERLIYVSPRSGQAVSADAGEPYKGRLLALPQFLKGAQTTEDDYGDIQNGLQMTAYFLQKHIFNALNRHVPDVRQRLQSHFAAKITSVAEKDNKTDIFSVEAA